MRAKRGAIAPRERSLKRLKTDYLDLYLLHGRGSVPLAETLETFQTLRETGKIRDYGVSDFDVNDRSEAIELPSGNGIVTNQVLYNLTRRGIERDLLPWCRDRGIPIMAYSPIERGRLLNNRTLQQIARERNVTPARVALAWLLHRPDAIVIPKSSRIEGVEDNRAALDLKSSPEELERLTAFFRWMEYPLQPDSCLDRGDLCHSCENRYEYRFSRTDETRSVGDVVTGFPFFAPGDFPRRESDRSPDEGDRSDGFRNCLLHYCITAFGI